MTSAVVGSRLREVCPPTKFCEMDIDEVEQSTRVAFKIIGYKPQNFSDSFRKSWETFEGEMLWEFIFDVWRKDL